MVIYTAIFGPYDDLKEPTVVTPGWDYVCFTDQPFKSKVWEIKPTQCRPFDDLRRTARWHKVNFHKALTLKPEELTIWLDGSFQIQCDLNWFVKRHRPPFTVNQHPYRDCVYAEGNACDRNRRDSKSVINLQLRRYRQAGIQPHSGVIASGVLVRNNTSEVQRFCNRWWAEIAKGSVRDQIAWALPARIWPNLFHTIPATDWDYRKSTDFKGISHLHKREK